MGRRRNENKSRSAVISELSESIGEQAPADVPPMDSPNVAHGFLVRLLKDVDSGQVLDLDAYEALFPANKRMVRREYLRLFGSSPDGPHELADLDAGSFGPYRIQHSLARGGQAFVYAAEDTRDGQQVALKVLRASDASDRLSRLRLQREANVLAKLQHPNLARVHGAGEERGVAFVATVLVSGTSLAERIERRKRTTQPPQVGEHMRTAALFEQVARALHAVHEAGLVHRDVKPGNILVTDEGTPVLIDFGLARDDETLASTLTKSGEVFGTFVYIAPELLEGGSRQADARVDVYSLGVTLYEALTLQTPFPGRTGNALLEAVLKATPTAARDLQPTIPLDLADVLRTAMARSPDDRYQTANDLAEDLARVGRGEPILARRPGLSTQLRRWVRRRRGLSSTLALLVLALLICTLLMFRWLAVERVALAQQLRLSDVQDFALLKERSVELWPELPQTVAPLQRWIDEVEDLRARLPLHRAYLAATFLPAGPRIRENVRVAAFVEELERFEPRLTELRGRRARAAGLHARTVAAHAHLWTETCAAVRAHAAYPELALRPQTGLVPLGRDPESGLFEFAHAATGVAPLRDPLSGELRLTEECGLVFVLLPGGRFLMKGMQADSWISLRPFLISKYELSQAQWLRLAGHNPSRWQPDSAAPAPVTLLHPVENVSWHAVRFQLAKHGLTLPTEAQWEYAARGGTSDAWWTGSERESLCGAVNIADASAARAGFNWSWIQDWPEHDDGYVLHAPIDALRANPFGLHGTLGNVREWCRDWYGTLDLFGGTPDGWRGGEGILKICRGGGFYDAVVHTRSNARRGAPPDSSDFSTGVRPTLELEP